MAKMIQSNLLPQKNQMIPANKMYFKILIQTGWERFENATSNSRFMILLNAISMD